MKTKALIRKARQLQTVETGAALWHLLKTSEYQAQLLMQNPPYEIFNIPKKNGGSRLIENPGAVLKKIQDRLNDHLQPLYYFNKTAAAYGFMIRPGDEPEARSIVTAARLHCANSHLLNMDLKDFFHQVSWQKVYDSLSEQPFRLNEALVKNLCNLCTFNGRLPMGAPTSPVLSNIAAREMDETLQQYCTGEKITYTRFADDLSFSSGHIITERHYRQLSFLIQQSGYLLNMEKVKWYPPGKEKTITGLTVTANGVAVPAEFLLETDHEIKNLKAYILMQKRLHPYKELERELVKPLQKIRGALAFIEAIHGPGYEKLQQLEQQLEEAQQPPADYESMSWLEIGYSFF